MEEVIEVPLDHLLDPQSIIEEMWTYRGALYKVPFFRFGKHKIWGAAPIGMLEYWNNGLNGMRSFLR